MSGAIGGSYAPTLRSSYSESYIAANSQRTGFVRADNCGCNSATTSRTINPNRSQTEGNSLPPEETDDAWLNDLPLLEVAKS